MNSKEYNSVQSVAAIADAQFQKGDFDIFDFLPGKMRRQCGSCPKTRNFLRDAKRASLRRSSAKN
jgi:ferritin